MIRLLSEETIDKIAAGEVVENPASCIKELCENSIDAGADTVNVEIKDGGVGLIRVSDNGCGIAAAELENAFLRHATSKITKIDDLDELESLGFRGEALSSIAAVSRLEIITKTHDNMIASRYVVEGGRGGEITEVGAPDGTTVIVRDLFYNTPARRKFLKSASAEGAAAQQAVERLAMSHPDVAFSFIINGRTAFQTYGRGELSEVIYQIYGREVASRLIKLDDGIVRGCIARPDVSRGNRACEIFSVNGRCIKDSKVLRGALEEAYSAYMMQHRFPFAVLNLHLDGASVDVNIHPQKLEVRFSDNERVFDLLRRAVEDALKERELIPETDLDTKQYREAQSAATQTAPSMADVSVAGRDEEQNTSVPTSGAHTTDSAASAADERQEALRDLIAEHGERKPVRAPLPFETNRILKESAEYEAPPVQLNLFEERILTEKAADKYEYIGQVFDTYWIIRHEDRMLLIDQHAAHEKVLYERFVKQIKEGGVYSQQLMPPIIVTLSATAEQALLENAGCFEETGFEIESFGGREYAIRAVPENLSSLNSRELFEEMLEELSENGGIKRESTLMKDRIATMACKAAVKGNNRLSRQEAVELVSELLTLENPYNCPHGRPTMIVMTKYELEKKFKRIV